MCRVLTHFGAVGSQLQNPLSLPDVRRSHLKGNLEYPPWALLPPSNLLGVAEEFSGGVQRCPELVALGCARNHHDIHDGPRVPPALPALLCYRPAKASPASWAASPHSYTCLLFFSLKLSLNYFRNAPAVFFNWKVGRRKEKIIKKKKL